MAGAHDSCAATRELEHEGRSHPPRRRARGHRLVAVGSIALAVAVACLGTLPVPAHAAPATSDAHRAGKRGPESFGDLEYQDAIDRTVASVARFWAAEFPEAFGQPYPGDPTVVGFGPGRSGGAVSQCSEGIAYIDMPPAFYCPLDDVIAYDDERFFPTLFSELGAFTTAVVLAHEWGHAIQKRVLSDAQREETPTVLTETQADCSAGAWAGWVADGNERGLEISDDDLAGALIGLVEFRDSVGLVESSAETAHGSAFDRVGAFEEGFSSGAARCASWLTEPPVITETPFENPLEIASGGNAPYGESIDAATTTLDTYWSATGDGFRSPETVKAFDPDKRSTLEPCRSLGLDPSRPRDYKKRVYFCRNDRSVRYDENLLRDVHAQIGDFAVAQMLSEAWAAAVQDDLDIDGSTASRLRHADCLSGSWAGSLPVKLADGSVVAARGGPVTIDFGDAHLAAGDLDEVLEVMLLRDDPLLLTTSSGGKRGAPASEFDRIDAFRTGFQGTDPLDACGGYVK